MLRTSAGNPRLLIDAPGFLYDPHERSFAVDLGSIVLKRGWTSYLYLTSGAATILLWEAALIDLWTNDRHLASRLRVMLNSIGAQIVHDK